MSSIQIRLWNETLSLDKVLRDLIHQGLVDDVIKLIAQKQLLLNKFAEFRILPPDEQVKQALLAAFYERLNLKTPESTSQWLQKNHVTQEALLRTLCFQNQLDRLKQVVISEEEVKTAFLKQKPRLDRMVFALIRVSQEAMARELYYRLCDDHQDFFHLAQEFSTGPEAENGGLVGPKVIQEMNQELQKVLLNLQPGDITEPFTLDGKQFLIARLLRLESVQLNPGITNNLRTELFDAWVERQLELAGIRVELPSTSDSLATPALEVTS